MFTLTNTSHIKVLTWDSICWKMVIGDYQKRTRRWLSPQNTPITSLPNRQFLRIMIEVILWSKGMRIPTSSPFHAGSGLTSSGRGRQERLMWSSETGFQAQMLSWRWHQVQPDLIATTLCSRLPLIKLERGKLQWRKNNSNLCWFILFVILNSILIRRSYNATQRNAALTGK